MAVSTIKGAPTFKLVWYRDVQVTWGSTANPFQALTKDVSLTGYKPIAFEAWPNGSGGTAIFAYGKSISGDSVTVGLRMVNNTPSTTTANKVDLQVLYARSDFVQ